MTHAELITLGRRWLSRPAYFEGHRIRGACSVIFSDLVTSAPETPDVIGWCNVLSIVIECKTSRSDFLRDHKKTTRIYTNEAVGRSRYYLTPAGLLASTDIKNGWGLLEVVGKKINMVVRSKIWDTCERHEIMMLLSALRRKHWNGKAVAMIKSIMGR